MKISKLYYSLLVLGLLCSRSEAQVINKKNLAEQVDKSLTEMETRGFSGAVLLSLDDKIELINGYGKSCNNIKIEPSMIFDLGSITKTITATGILKLFLQGKLQPSDTLGEFIDNIPADKEAITIQQLLTHTSGLLDYLGPDETWIDRESLLKKAMKSELKFKPGSDQSYSNVGYTLLGYIIENVTNKFYEEYLSESIFEQIDIHNTGYMIPTWEEGKIVCGIRDGEKWGSVKDYYSPEGPSWYLMANGGMLSTLNDLNVFFNSLISGKLLNKDLTELIVSAQTDLTKKSNRRLYSTSGSNYIFSSLYMNWLDENVVLIIFTSNSDWPKEKVYPSLLPLIDQYLDQKTN